MLKIFGAIFCPCIHSCPEPPDSYRVTYSLILIAEGWPHNEILSVDKVITWLGPPIAMDGLFPLQFSQEVSFLQELNRRIPAKAIMVIIRKCLLIT